LETATNGWFIRAIGRNRITDGFIVRCFWSITLVFFPPLPLYVSGFLQFVVNSFH